MTAVARRLKQGGHLIQQRAAHKALAVEADMYTPVAATAELVAHRDRTSPGTVEQVPRNQCPAGTDPNSLARHIAAGRKHRDLGPWHRSLVFAADHSL